MSSFMGTVAETLPEQGVLTFGQIASSDALFERMMQDNIMLVALIDAFVVGYVELKQRKHIAMLFVAPEYQRQGVGRSLLSEIKRAAASPKLTVHASTTSVSAYERYGFVSVGDIAVSEGLIYQPMELRFEDYEH
ncbi:GNAT family N-acetyltransferase [Pseudoalteromonas sp. MMG021]|nr:GNAT family N-acetyltransferase [Pseudoalteromonas sp. MMG022]